MKKYDAVITIIIIINIFSQFKMITVAKTMPVPVSACLCCQYMSVPVRSLSTCQHMLLHVHACQYMSVFVSTCHCLPMLSVLFIPVSTFQCLLVHVSTCQCLSVLGFCLPASLDWSLIYISIFPSSWALRCGQINTTGFSLSMACRCKIKCLCLNKQMKKCC